MRVPNPDDRRVWLVENTTEGDRLAIEIVRVDEQLRDQLRAGISRRERQQLADLLLRMSANASAAMNGDDQNHESKNNHKNT